MHTVAIRTEPELEVGPPRVLFERSNLLSYDVTPDGNRFLVIEREPTATPTQIHVVVNWFDELNRLVPLD